MANITDPVTITLTMHGVTHTVEGLDWDSSADDLIDAFKRLLVGAAFPPSILNDEDGGYEYVRYDENKDSEALKWTNPDKFNDADWYGKKHNNPLLDSPTC